MATDLKNANARRKVLRAILTRQKTYIESPSASEHSRHEIAARRQKFVEAYTELDAIQSIIENLEEAQIESVENPDYDRLRVMHEEQRKTFEDAYFQTLAKFDALLDTRQEVPTVMPYTGNIAPSGGHHDLSIRLPKLELKTFSGSYEEWCPFRDTYVALIHSNETIPVIHKFQYLSSCLKGTAADAIESLKITAANYNVAWDLLTSRFENTRWIVQSHIRAIFESRVVYKENHVDLRELLDGVLKHLRALRALKRPIDTWDDMIVYMIVSKLDLVTAKEWEKSLVGRAMPTLSELTQFLQQRIQALDSLSVASATSNRKLVAQKPIAKNAKQAAAHAASSNVECAACGEAHFLYQCHKFRAMSIESRVQLINRLGLCRNCMRTTHHRATNCTGSACRKCNQKHNTLLHMPRSNDIVEKRDSSSAFEAISTTDKTNSEVAISRSAVNCAANSHDVLLSTAVINTFDVNNGKNPCRVLLDNGSQLNFISAKFAKRLDLPQKSFRSTITGIGGGITKSTKLVTVRIGSRINAYVDNIDCIVLPTVTDRLPHQSFSLSDIRIPRNIILADEHFNESSDVDMIIGAELFWRLICIGQMKTSRMQPTFQKTLFGWIVSGATSNLNQRINSPKRCHLAIDCDLNNSLKRFWEIEHGLLDFALSPEERECEMFFEKTFRRTSEGRFVVRLPVKDAMLNKLGDSYSTALKMYYSLEKRLIKNPICRQQYNNFIREYETLGHMREVSPDLSDRSITYYMPHHCVIKESSATTKLRVVFNASAKTSSGISLNDALRVGPVLQQDLFSRLLQFRTYEYAFTGDIAKMYRQVLIEPSQTKLQRILWRDSPTEPLKNYELLTVTYGTASASYLVIKSIRKLAEIHQATYPLGAKVVLNQFYVDDVLSGAQSLDEALKLKHETTQLLKLGGFELRKWTSNSSLLREGETSADKEFTEYSDPVHDAKALGIVWDSYLDYFKFTDFRPPERLKVPTKRSILSKVSKIFDPLGLLGPSTLMAKTLLQDLWRAGSSWDDPLSDELRTKWELYESQMDQFKNVIVPRKVFVCKNPIQLQVHGFCDASEIAYGACIYIRATSQKGDSSARLWCSKSRVSPLKSLSIPKLELCGALLLAKLLHKVLPFIGVTMDNVYLWSDSRIVLCWLKSCSKRWNCFVANRVGEIQSLTPGENWRHVRGTENPADVISRGLMPKDLLAHDEWWLGPSWLAADESHWPRDIELHVDAENLPEQRVQQVFVTLSRESDFDIFHRYSSLKKLFRVTAYCLKFVKKLKGVNVAANLTLSDIREAKLKLILNVQTSAFRDELESLKNDKYIHKSSFLYKLNPVIDHEGLLRVGGRLKHSSLSYDSKHAILLPGKHIFTEMIVLHEHERLNHAGAYQTLSSLRQNYWPISGRDIVRKIVNNCLACSKARPKFPFQLMGELPKARVEIPPRPFATCGVDYAGPLLFKDGGRGRSRLIKCYLAIFVCFASKAVHLELSADLSSETFINLLKRFISRRGRPLDMYSDNGLNFIGANHELKELYRLFNDEMSRAKIVNFAIEEQINWHFIPPHAPHFGGLWESAVKSAKLLLRRVTQDANLRYDELFTLLVQIEGILNSRPLTKLSDDPRDLQPLTPAHFLIGAPITSLPEPSLIHLPATRLSRWQYVEQIKQHFWKRWSVEYLHTLQKRTKWNKENPHIHVGQLIVLRQANVPVMTWPMGIIESVHPGLDGLVRTVTVRTSKGVYKRPITEIGILPVEMP